VHENTAHIRRHNKQHTILPHRVLIHGRVPLHMVPVPHRVLIHGCALLHMVPVCPHARACCCGCFGVGGHKLIETICMHAHIVKLRGARLALLRPLRLLCARMQTQQQAQQQAEQHTAP
jgi:hypothetical protein